MEQAIKNYDEMRLVKLAELIVKYQKYQTQKIWEKVLEQPCINMSKSTAVNYINLAICYLNTGKKYSSIPTSLYKHIDECIANHLQPLTPSFSERRRVIKRDYTKKDVKLPIEKNPVIKKAVTEKFDYGVKIENRIILFDKESDMNQFIKNVKYINSDIELEAVTVECDQYVSK